MDRVAPAVTAAEIRREEYQTVDFFGQDSEEGKG
jgi:hypothetical protein